MTRCEKTGIDLMKFGLWMGTYNIGYKINYGKLHHINMFIKVSVYGLFNLHDTCVQYTRTVYRTTLVYAAYEKGVLEASSLEKFYGL